MSSTKDKIISSALKLFNRDGMVNVRLQHIADEAFVSVGNLAYHYPNKESILQKLYEQITQRQNELLAEFRIVPLFENFNHLLEHTFQLQNEFVFFYLDTLEILRSYPTIGKDHRHRIETQIIQIKSTLDFNISRGALLPEIYENSYEKLASQIWMAMDFWLSQQAVKTEKIPDVQLYKADIWNLLIPYFTEMGKREYDQMLQRPYDSYFE